MTVHVSARRRSGVFIVNFEHISHLGIFSFAMINIKWRIKTKTS